MEGQLVELTEEELKEADLEMVRYRRQARVEGAYPDVGLLAVSGGRDVCRIALVLELWRATVCSCPYFAFVGVACFDKRAIQCLGRTRPRVTACAQSWFSGGKEKEAPRLIMT